MPIFLFGRPELKPRHLRGKRREEFGALQAARAAAAARRLAEPRPEPVGRAALLSAQLERMLRPKFQRWCMYEWFYSPVDYGWFRENEFTKLLRDCGLGQVTHLLRVEWA